MTERALKQRRSVSLNVEKRYNQSIWNLSFILLRQTRSRKIEFIRFVHGNFEELQGEVRE